MKSKLGTSDVHPLWVADMDFRCPPMVIDALKQRAEEGIFGYTTLADDAYLFRAASAWQKRRLHWDIPVEWMEYSPGVVNSIFYLVSVLCDPGDRVILQNPVYPPFRSVIKDGGLEWVDNRLIEKEVDGQSQYCFDLEDLKLKAADPHNKVLLLCSPSNPGGRVWNKDELLAVKEIADQNDLFVISDEIHSDLVFPGITHMPWGKISSDENWAVLFSPSKSFNIPGLSTSFAVIPNESLRQKFVLKKYHLHGAMENPFGLVAALAAYQSADPWMDELKEYLQENYRLLKDALPSNISIFRQQGTYLAWLDVQALGGIEDIKQFFFKDRGLGVQLGRDFGPGGKNFVRFNFALPRPKLKELLQRL